MRSKRLAIPLALLLGLVGLPAAFAGTRGPDPRADLVVVLNMTPAKPSGGEIWLMDLSGRLVRRITKNNYHEEYPSFSPDGNRIVFVRNLGEALSGRGSDPKNNEIFVYDLRTGVETRLTRNSVEDSHPEWSFDGKYIAFHSRRADPQERATLWIMEADGSNPRQISQLLPGDFSHQDPNWGPDGQWLAFVNYREEDGHRYSRIEKVRLDGSQRTVVSSGGKYVKASGTKELLGDLAPVHSPEGAMIWASRRLGEGTVHLFTFGAGSYYGGKAETDMDWPVQTGGIEQNPRFSPDGRRLLLTRFFPKTGIGTRQVVLTDPQSSFRRYLTSREDWDVWHPSWHPFARSGAEREDGGRRVSYPAGAVESKTLLAKNENGSAANYRLPEAGAVRLATTVAEPAGMRVAPAATYEARWKLDVPPAKVSSLTFRYQGKFPGEDATAGKSVAFQLMDWDSKSWVTVYVRSGISAEAVEIQHEIAPANFLSRDKQEVALRVIASGSLEALFPSLQTREISLDVKHD